MFDVEGAITSVMLHFAPAVFVAIAMHGSASERIAGFFAFALLGVLTILLSLGLLLNVKPTQVVPKLLILFSMPIAVGIFAVRKVVRSWRSSS